MERLRSTDRNSGVSFARYIKGGQPRPPLYLLAKLYIVIENGYECRSARGYKAKFMINSLPDLAKI